MYYNTGNNTLFWWNGTAWVSASGAGGGMNLDYFGSYAPGTYNDGDIVIGSDGIAYICVVDGTTTAPVPWTGVSGPAGPTGPQGPQGPQGVKGDTGAASPLVPAVQNGKWLTASGGAAVWANITQADLPTNLGAQVATAPGKDLNNATANGWYGVSQDTDSMGPTANRPIAYGQVQTLFLSAGNIRQVCYGHGSLDIYQRYCAAGTWSGWVQTQWTPDANWIVVTAFQNGWGNYGGQFPGARYRKLANGMVVMSGLLNNTDWTGKANTVAFNLPVGYRPDAYRHMITDAVDNWGTVRISNNGDVMFAFGTAGWVTLDNVSFFP